MTLRAHLGIGCSTVLGWSPHAPLAGSWRRANLYLGGGTPISRSITPHYLKIGAAHDYLQIDLKIVQGHTYLQINHPGLPTSWKRSPKRQQASHRWPSFHQEPARERWRRQPAACRTAYCIFSRSGKRNRACH